MPGRFPHTLASGLVLAGLLIVPNAVQAHGRGGQGPFGHHQQRSVHRVVRHVRSLTGRIVSISAAAAPATLSLRTGRGAMVTVNISVTTRFLRHYGGASALTELMVGDRLTVWGTFEAGAGSVFDAARIQDLSLQRSLVRVEGRVASISATGGLLRFRGPGLFRRSRVVAFTYAPAVIVMSGPATTTVAAIQPGVHVVMLGLYNRQARLLRVLRVRILQARPVPRPTSTPVAATATATASITPPATLTPTATATLTPTATLTATATITPTDTATITATPTMTATVAPTATYTGTVSAP